MPKAATFMAVLATLCVTAAAAQENATRENLHQALQFRVDSASDLTPEHHKLVLKHEPYDGYDGGFRFSAMLPRGWWDKVPAHEMPQLEFETA